MLVSDIAIFVLKRDVELQLTNYETTFMQINQFDHLNTCRPYVAN